MDIQLFNKEYLHKCWPIRTYPGESGGPLAGRATLVAGSWGSPGAPRNTSQGGRDSKGQCLFVKQILTASKAILDYAFEYHQRGYCVERSTKNVSQDSLVAIHSLTKYREISLQNVLLWLPGFPHLFFPEVFLPFAQRSPYYSRKE